MQVKCVLYRDGEQKPTSLPLMAVPDSVSALRAYLERETERPVRLLSCWNYRRKRYEVLLSMSQVTQAEALVPCSSGTGSSSSIQYPNGAAQAAAGETDQTSGGGAGTTRSHTEGGSLTAVYRAQLWLETHFFLMEQVDPVEDADEYRELAEHVRLFAGNRHVTYELTRAARLQYGHLSRMFDRTRDELLHARKDDIRLLFYANNAWSTSDAIQFGFLLREGVPPSLEASLRSGLGVGTEGPGEARADAALGPPLGGGAALGGEVAGPSPRASSPASNGLPPAPTAAEDDPAGNTRRRPFTFTSSMMHPKERRPRIKGQQKLLLCEVAPGRAWYVDEPITTLLAAAGAGPTGNTSGAHDGMERPPEGYDSLLYEEARSRSVSGKATPERPQVSPPRRGSSPSRQTPPLVQVTVGLSHQALPRYLLTIEPTRWEGGGLRGLLGVRHGSCERSRTTGEGNGATPAKRKKASPRGGSPAGAATLMRGGSPGGGPAPLHSPCAAQAAPTLPPPPLPSPQRQPELQPAHLVSTPQPPHLSPSPTAALQSTRPSPSPRRTLSAPPAHPRSPSRGEEGLLYSSRLGCEHRSPSAGAREGGPGRWPRLRLQGPLAASDDVERRGGARGAEASPAGSRIEAWVSGRAPALRHRTLPPRYEPSGEGPSLLTPPPSPSRASARGGGGRQPFPMYAPNGSSPLTPAAAAAAVPAQAHARAGTPTLIPSAFAPRARGGAAAASPQAAAALAPAGPVVVPPALRCPTHPQSLRNVFCLTCQELTCAYCASLGHHRGHDVTEADTHAVGLLRQVQEVCHDLAQLRGHFARVEAQLRVELGEAAAQQQRRVHALHGQFAEVRQALDRRECALGKQLADLSERMRPPLAEAVAVRETYAAALQPLDGCLRSFQASRAVRGGGGEAEVAAATAGRSPRAQLSTLQFVRTAPQLLTEARLFLDSRDRREEEQLRSAVAAVQASNQRADSLVAAVDTSELRRCVEALGSPAVAGPLLLTHAASPGPRGLSRSPTRTGSPNKSRYDEWATTSPVRETSVLLRGGQRGVMGGGATDRATVLSEGAPNLALVERCLLDLQRGHIWAIPNASTFFCAGQTKAVCSTHFHLKGLTWELRIAPLPRPEERARGVMLGQPGSPAAGASVDARPTPVEVMLLGSTSTRGGESGGAAAVERPPPLPQPGPGPEPADEQQWLGIFLFPVGHRQRLDFRVIAFSEVSWTEWKVAGWTDAFAGKGWGLYPFLQRKDLVRLDKLARDNIVKICIAPISDLY